MKMTTKIVSLEKKPVIDLNDPMTKEKAQQLAELFLGIRSSMLGSKSRYSDRHKENFVVFNSNLITKEYGKVWYGDLDLTKSEAVLIQLSKALGVELYVLYEMDGRFDNEEAPKIEKAVFKVAMIPAVFKVAMIPFLSFYIHEGIVLSEYHKRDKKTGVVKKLSQKNIMKVFKEKVEKDAATHGLKLNSEPDSD